jgi:hypothetical protein
MLVGAGEPGLRSTIRAARRNPPKRQPDSPSQKGSSNTDGEQAHQSPSQDVRTTLDIDDDILSAARSIAAAEGRSIGSALSMITRRGLHPSVRAERGAGGFPIFDVAVGGPITSEAVRAALDEEG